MRKRHLAALVVVAAMALGAPAAAATVLWDSGNTVVYLGLPFWDLEFENPLVGSEQVLCHNVIDWRDADFTPPTYDDWTVSDPANIDGDANEIWMRQRDQWITTTTTVASTIVSIHLVGDSNDGLADVSVDGTLVAQLDMGTTGTTETALIIVKGLPNAVHVIEVKDKGAGSLGGDDVATLGAAALAECEIKWEQPPDPIVPADPFYYGWNEKSLYRLPFAADDWVCDSPDPVTDIHWWGSYLGWRKKLVPPASLQPDYFHIAIWTDVPADPPNEPFSHPGYVIWETDCYDFSCVFDGWDYDPRTREYEACFKFEQYLDPADWFDQEEYGGVGNIFWLSIAAAYPAGQTIDYPWGWKTLPRDTASPAPDDAVRILDPTEPHLGSPYTAGEPIYWPDPDQSWDLAFELTTQTLQSKWEQLPNPQLSGLHCHDDSTGGFITIADDWQCDGGDVTDFHWWGNYEAYGSGISHFHLSIHDNVGAPPNGMPINPPAWEGDIFAFTETPTGVTTPTGEMIYRYDVILPDPYLQLTGRIYWLDISSRSNSLTNPAIWRWQEHARNPLPLVTLSPAVDSNSGGPWSYIHWPFNDTYSEMAFRVTSGDPAPAIKWSQPPRQFNPDDIFNGWNEESVYDDNRYPIVADDWYCDTHQPVTDIHWWGSYIGWDYTDPPNMPDAFHIAIWDDVPDPDPGDPDTYSHPGRCLWQNICDTFTWQFVGWDYDPRVDPVTESPWETCFKFEQELLEDDWFWQDEYGHPGPKIFWVSIAAIYNTLPSDHLWGWKTRPHYFQDDAMRILDPIAPGVGSIYNNGEPIYWPNPEDSWDMAFVLTTIEIPIGSLTFEPNHFIRDHYWWNDPADQDNEMISFWVIADPTEAVSWDSVTLQAWGTGDDAADIAAVKVWLDNDDDGKVTAADTLIGSGTYPGDNGAVTIALAPAPIIPAGGSVSALISYTMNAGVTPGSTYMFAITGASGTGQTSGQPVPIFGLPLTSAKKTVSVGPISIGEAKLLTVGTPFILQGKVLTADLRTYGNPPMNLFYIEEEKRPAGIGVVDMLGLGALNVGDRVYLEGTCFLLNSCELVIDPDHVSTAAGTAITPVGMNNKWTGGGIFGGQPDLVDDAYALPPTMSMGLNNVGMLIRTWGRVTCYQPNYNTPSITGDMFWINDGANLMDGFTCLQFNQPTVGVDVLQAPLSIAPDVGDYYSVTGILRAIPNFAGDPVRLLVPRDPGDMDYNPEP